MRKSLFLLVFIVVYDWWKKVIGKGKKITFKLPKNYLFSGPSKTAGSRASAGFALDRHA
jgi:hypothetical protein